MDDESYLLEEQRDLWQKHLAIEEASMGDYQSDDSDATGYVPPTAEEVRGPDRIDVGPLPEGYKETFQYGEGVGVVGPIDVETLVREADRLIDAVRGSIGWSPDFKAEPETVRRYSPGNREIPQSQFDYQHLTPPPIYTHTPTSPEAEYKEALLDALSLIERYLNKQTSSLDKALDACFVLYQHLKNL